MKNTLSLSILVLVIGFNSYSQLNDYKYIIVPKKFETFKKANQYQTSTLLKYLFNTNGYTAIYDDVMPDDLKTNSCLALKIQVEDSPSLFSTKVRLLLKDCNGIVVFSSQEGRSKKKEFKEGYTEAIKKAFESYKTMSYQYSPKEKEKEKPIVVSFKNDVKSLEDKVEKTSLNETKSEAIEKGTIALDDKSKEIKATDFKKIAKNDTNNSKQNLETLYAQATNGGFQLVDSTPQIQYKLLETSVKDVFLATHGDKNGVVLKKDGKWFFEYNENEQKVLKELNIKF
jgi:hypothetical protein